VTSLLTQAQRQQFTRFPKLDERLLARHYLLDATELNAVLNRRRNFNRLGYAVQLTVLKHLGRGLAAAEQPPKDVLIFLSEQLELDPALPADDGVDGRTAAAQDSNSPNSGAGTAGGRRACSGRSTHLPSAGSGPG
jgi:hypothetical protein